MDIMGWWGGTWGTLTPEELVAEQGYDSKALGAHVVGVVCFFFFFFMVLGVEPRCT